MTVKQSEASRLGPIFDVCRDDGRAALIGYLPTGYPDVTTSVHAMVALVESGCDIVEVGVPYSDPGMDGPTIVKATEAALHGECASATPWPRSRRSAPPGPRRGDDLLEPRVALRN